MLRTVPDGVKRKIMTASRVKVVTAQKKREGVTRRASRVNVVTAYNLNTHDGVKPRSRQSDKLFGGEMTASDVCS